jgi:penicillin-binding protein 1A
MRAGAGRRKRLIAVIGGIARAAPGMLPQRVMPRATRPLAPPEAARKRRWGRTLLKWAVILLVWSALALTGLILWFAHDTPRPETALDAPRRPSLMLQDRAGRVFATFGDVVGEPLRLRDMPPALPAALIAVEDRRFRHHFGIDPIGLARAAWVNLRAGRVAQGGSTITQQVAKTLFLSNARTVRRKAQELILTIWLEQRFSKDEILEIYLNRVYLGAGAWGVDAGARLFFGVSARRVELWQAALLAGLPRAPSRFNPNTNTSAAAARAREVLAAMEDTGAISPAQRQAAEARIGFPPTPRTAPGWFADWIADRATAAVPQGADATLRTTLDSRLQASAETKLAALLDGPGAARGVGQGAVVIMDPMTGAVRALVGGRNHRDSAFNRATLARRQPGSAFKPFVWLAALEAGQTPDDLVLDAPIQIGGWAPRNHDKGFLGQISLEEALARSINTAAVRLLLASGGPKATAAVARRLGIQDRLPQDASLALGTGEVSLLELTAAYAAFFNGGRRVMPFGLEGGMAAHLPPVMRADHAEAMARMLTAVVTGGTARPAALPPGSAGKTGTTQEFRDAWFIGTARGLLIGVWLGNDDNTPMRNVTGGELPARLFREIALAER